MSTSTVTSPQLGPFGWKAALLGSLLLAALSTVGDLVWALWIPNGRMIHGVVHGAIIFLALGLVLGLAAGGGSAVRRAMSVELVIGVLISASFYPLYRLIGPASLFVTWMALWIATALLDRTLREPRPALGTALLRGTVAAVLSGLAFWAVSGIWTNPAPGGPNLAWHFLCWTFAFLPGFLALLLRRGALHT